jgi:cytidyltransferase-like protein
MKIVIATGGFDPVHSGHIRYLEEARSYGDKLVVGLNSDAWLTRKKGRPFMPFGERQAVLEGLCCVDEVVAFDDNDGSAVKLLESIQKSYSYAEIIFVNGGDRTAANIPEMSVKNVLFKFGVGGQDKANSSSWILGEWCSPKTQRPWGYYRVLHEVPGLKVKELTVNPGQSLSMQRHTHRAEYWIVSNGSCVVNSELDGGYKLPPTLLHEHLEYRVPVGEWHQLTNPYSEPVKIVEIQYGLECNEEDIERKNA